jgi:quercetin dioxygenase-like cupin family protein
MKNAMIGAAAAFGLLALSAASTVPATAQQIQRKVLLTQDLAIPGYQTVSAAVEIPPGGREESHTHPGAVVVYVLEGALTLDYEGHPTTTYKAGESFFIEGGKIHAGINDSSLPVKLIATFVVEKGKPLTTAAQ